jgi:AcrR family transcriptional regulator
MNKATSKLESSRQTGKHQVDEQRASILDAAERLFLQNGLENTRMVDIAAQAGITKITLYRYFPNRDVIAIAIQVRMLDQVGSLVCPCNQIASLESARKVVQSMIRNFDSLRDAYRYIGMFDRLYLDNPLESSLSQWTKNQLISVLWNGEVGVPESAEGNRVLMVVSTVIWFLEKLALRGELTWSDQTVPLEEHLKLFEEMIMGYIDQFVVK